MAMIMYSFVLRLGPAPSPVPDRGLDVLHQRAHGRRSAISQGPARRSATPLSILPCVQEVETTAHHGRVGLHEPTGIFHDRMPFLPRRFE